MRLIDKSRKTPTLEALGLSEAMRDRIARDHRQADRGAARDRARPARVSRRRSTPALAQINRPEINVITVEDPVEYRLAGINQVQINTKAGLTFATALRSILRSDPDVVMVGEIRDGETAKIAIEAALTGHFVLSTLHTNDAPGALTRLNEMGVEPFLTGSAVSAVLAQRLARKLCANCCEMYAPSYEDLVAARISPDVGGVQGGNGSSTARSAARAAAAPAYKGRIGVFQLLVMNDELEGLAASNASREEIQRGRDRRGHAHALGRRPGQGRGRPDLPRGARAGRLGLRPPPGTAARTRALSPVVCR